MPPDATSVATREVWELPTTWIGRQVLVFDQLDSTNTRALRLGDDPASEGIALLADEQVQGRGQHGRQWLAPPRSCVLLSVLLYPPAGLARPVILTAWAATAVCLVVHELTGQVPQIKWPNDVLVDGKKVCGILIEQSHTERGPATVAGIGLNVTQSRETFLAADLPDATSLTALGGVGLDTHGVARRLLASLDDLYTRLVDGDIAAVEGRWREFLGLTGQAVEVELLDAGCTGRVLAVGFEGIVVHETNGAFRALLPESVLHIRQR